MKKLLFATMLLAGITASAQGLTEIRSQQLETQKTGMLILGSWAVANLVGGPIFASRTSGSTKYFHQMNALWNTVNLGLAGFSLLTMSDAAAASTYNEVLAGQLKIEKLLLFNAGLDIAYVAAGFYLKERARNLTKDRDRFTGFGNSLLLQGAFLFLFDVGFYLAYHSHFQELIDISSNLTFSLAPGSFSLKLRL